MNLKQLIEGFPLPPEAQIASKCDGCFSVKFPEGSVTVHYSETSADVRVDVRGFAPISEALDAYAGGLKRAIREWEEAHQAAWRAAHPPAPRKSEFRSDYQRPSVYEDGSSHFWERGD